MISLVNTYITSHSCNFVCVCVCVMRTFKIYSLSNFWIYNIVLLTMVTMLQITSSELFSL